MRFGFEHCAALRVENVDDVLFNCSLAIEKHFFHRRAQLVVHDADRGLHRVLRYRDRFGRGHAAVDGKRNAYAQGAPTQIHKLTIG